MSTVVMPNGQKYRISSKRRYITVVWRNNERWLAIKRSDKLDTALVTWRSQGRYTPDLPAHVIDVKAEGGPAVIR